MHFCSSTYKDAVQLRERLIRTAENTARSIDEITEEGTIVYGQIICETDQLASKVASYIREHDIEDDMAELSGIRVETAWWILDDLAEDIRTLAKEMFIIERYPFEHGLIVEKIPV